MINKQKVNLIIAEFKNEGVVPFWMWNDKLEKTKLLSQLREIKKKGMNQVIIHPRFGLETYLSDEWFTAVGWVLREAEIQNMGVWIYDELNWPSGYGGGLVLKNHPEFRAQHLVKTNKGFKKKKTTWHPAYSKGYYIDVLNPDAVVAFINVTHGQYWQRFKKYFGKTILGFFTDEPGLYNNFAGVDIGSLPWTNRLPDFFEEKKGYSLKEVLRNIWEDNGIISVEARVDFWEIVSLLYQESYFKKIQNWCHQRGVAFIGHVLAEESIVDTIKTQGNFFSTMRFLDMAGYDLLTRLEQKTIIAVNLARSARKMFNLPGVCAETFGIFGWGLKLKEMKRVVRWQIKAGLDVLIPHALYYSQSGDRKNDCPPSFFASKYWRIFDKFVFYVRDLLKKIKSKSPRVAIYYPIESVWGLFSPIDSSKADVIDNVFKVTSFACYNLGVSFDYITGKAVLDKGLDKYSYLLLPQTEVLSFQVLKKIVFFLEAGGKVIVVGDLPKFATKSRDQRVFSRILEEKKSLLKHVVIKESVKVERRSKNFKKLLKNFIKRLVSPIWLARMARLAKFLGYQKSNFIKQKTGFENELEKALKM